MITPAMGATQIVGTIKGARLGCPRRNLLPGGGTFDGVTLLSDYTVTDCADAEGSFSEQCGGLRGRWSADNRWRLHQGELRRHSCRRRSGQIDGTWNLGTDSFDFNGTTGSWQLSSSGTISGGTLTAHDGQGLSIYQGILDHVTLAMRPTVPYQQDCVVTNGLTLLPGGGIDVASSNYFWFLRDTNDFWQW